MRRGLNHRRLRIVQPLPVFLPSLSSKTAGPVIFSIEFWRYKSLWFNLNFVVLAYLISIYNIIIFNATYIHSIIIYRTEQNIKQWRGALHPYTGTQSLNAFQAQYSHRSAWYIYLL